MKRVGFHFISFALACLVATSSCSQNNSTANHAVTDIFVGSTPCDPFINALLKIPPATKCDFIKWELRFQKNNSDSFLLTVLYGEAKPNTNGFMGGGNKLVVDGRYEIKAVAKVNQNKKVYYLYSEQLRSPLLLIELDENIFHFADANNNFIVGNAGYSFVLNRIQ